MEEARGFLQGCLERLSILWYIVSIMVYSLQENALMGYAPKPLEEYDLLSVVMIRLGEVPLLDDGSVDGGELEKNVIGMLEVLLKGELSAGQRKSILVRRRCGPRSDGPTLSFRQNFSLHSKNAGNFACFYMNGRGIMTFRASFRRMQEREPKERHP